MQQELDTLSDYEWYFREKSNNGEMATFWRVTWPEGGQQDKQTTNFIVTLYLSAPTKQAALREFQRWANLRMQDIPRVVLEPVGNEEVLRCPLPNFMHNGDAIAGVWKRLT